MGYNRNAFDSHLLVSFPNKNLLTLLAEFVGTGPMRVQLCSSLLFYQDEVKTTIKIASLMKSRITDHELCGSDTASVFRDQADCKPF
jgi:hypothetical protein